MRSEHLGFGGLNVSEDAGGAGLSRLDSTLVFEALSQSCASVAAFLSIHNMCARHDRGLWDRRSENPAHARHSVDGNGVVLLPDRTGVGLGCRGTEGQSRKNERGLEAIGHQGVHIGRRIFGCLCRHGPVGRRQPARHLGLPDRRRHRWSEFRRIGRQDGLAQPTDAAGAVGQLQCSGGKSAWK